MVKILKSVFWVLFLPLILLGFPKLAGTIANAFDYGVIDPDGVFAWLFVHHIAQTVLFIALIMIIRLYRPINFHLGWGDVKFGRRYVLRFTSYFIRY